MRRQLRRAAGARTSSTRRRIPVGGAGAPSGVQPRRAVSHVPATRQYRIAAGCASPPPPPPNVRRPAPAPRHLPAAARPSAASGSGHAPAPAASGAARASAGAARGIGHEAGPPDLLEHGAPVRGAPQTSTRRLFVQLHVLTGLSDPAAAVEAVRRERPRRRRVRRRQRSARRRGSPDERGPCLLRGGRTPAAGRERVCPTDAASRNDDDRPHLLVRTRGGPRGLPVAEGAAQRAESGPSLGRSGIRSGGLGPSISFRGRSRAGS